MRYLLIFYLILIIFGCTLTEPSSLIIKNESEYTIEVSLSNGNRKEITIQKNKGEIVLMNPGDVEIKVKIEEIKYKKEYSLNLGYLEKKKFVFSIDE